LGLIALGKWKELGRSILNIIFMIGIVLLITRDLTVFPVFLLIFWGRDILFVYPWQVATRSLLIDRGDSSAPNKFKSNIPEYKMLFTFKGAPFGNARDIMKSQEKRNEEIHFAIGGTNYKLWIFLDWQCYLGISDHDLVQAEMDYLHIEPFRVVRDPITSIKKIEMKEGIITLRLSITLNNGIRRIYRIPKFYGTACKTIVSQVNSRNSDRILP
jgi:hypothetical protein